MKQILQSLKTGQTSVSEVPCPSLQRGHLLIQSSVTLVSAGTERMLVEFGKAGWISKARQQPDKVKMVIDKIGTDGLLPTLDAVFNKLDQPLPLGYCNVGVVLEAGAGVSGWQRGERVVSNGKHAEAVNVPLNLCARIPPAVPDEHAAFTVLAAIGLQGIRLAAPTLGEAVVVTGLGLIGLLTVQLLRAHGCRVLGIDFDPAKLALARRFGADVVDLGAGEDPVAAAALFSRGRGVDAVLITASTASSEPLHQAALMARKRGRIVLVGVAGLELSRADFYEKELTFQVSCSYGPGRYDPLYEDQGQDYPAGFVRWTAQRNFEAVLDMMADGRLDVGALVTHRFSIEQAEHAYALLSDRAALGILLHYRAPAAAAALRRQTVAVSAPAARAGAGRPVLGFIGAGNYAGAVLIPAFARCRAQLHTVASNGGVSGLHAARKFGFVQTTTDTGALLSDAGIDALVVSTRHDSHASLVCAALAAGKQVFVEKPLAIDAAQLAEIEAAYRARAAHGPAPLVMVGFNRRFAPHVVRMKQLLHACAGPKMLAMTVNAGAIPAAHWTQDRAVGGGRIIGEACHFVDLLRHLAGAPIVGHSARKMDDASGDTVALELRFADGSLGTILYLANGSKAFPKERLEVFCAGRILQLDNFRRLKGFGWPGFRSMNLWRQDKGQRACAAAFVAALTEGTAAPIDFEELLEVSRVTLALAAEAA